MLNPRDIAQFVGGAPRNDESGTRAGARHMRGGRAEGRVVLSRATLTATRWHPRIKAFSQRVRARGKSQQVARTAAMRTRLTILNAMVNPHTQWNARVTHGLVPASAPCKSLVEYELGAPEGLTKGGSAAVSSCVVPAP